MVNQFYFCNQRYGFVFYLLNLFTRLYMEGILSNIVVYLLMLSISILYNCQIIDAFTVYTSICQALMNELFFFRVYIYVEIIICQISI